MMSLQAAILPPTAGWSWIVLGTRLFRRQPMAMLFWSITTSFFINVGALIPILGQTALVLLTPLLTFLTLCACRNLDENVRMMPGLWLQPLQTPGVTGRLLRLGLLYLGCSFVIALLALLPFLSSMLDAIGTADQPDFVALAQAMQAPMIVFGLFYIVLSALFWHTPALVGWHGLPMRRALFYSMVACWRNKYPLIVYVACWAAVFFGLHALLDGLAATGVSEVLLAWLSMPLDILITALLYCSFYPIYTTIFRLRTAAST